MGREAEARKRAGLAGFFFSCLNQMLVMIQSNFDSTFSFFPKQFIYSSNVSNSYKINKTNIKILN